MKLVRLRKKMNDKQCLLSIKTDIATIKETLKNMGVDIVDIKKDINGIYPKVNLHGEEIAVMKKEIEGVISNWKVKEQNIDGSMKYFKALTGILGVFDMILIAIIGLLVGLK